MTCGIRGFSPHLSLCPFFGSLSGPRFGSPPRSREGSRGAPLPWGPPSFRCDFGACCSRGGAAPGGCCGRSFWTAGSDLWAGALTGLGG